MDVKDVKVGNYYWDSLHGDSVYCVKVFDNGNEDDSYIRSYTFDGKYVKEWFVPASFVCRCSSYEEKYLEDDMDIRSKVYTSEDGNILPLDEYVMDKVDNLIGTVVVLAGEGVGVVYDHDTYINEILVVSVSGGILERSSIALHVDHVYVADSYYKSKLQRLLGKNGFYYDDKFKFIFKSGDLKSNIFKYEKPPRKWDWNSIGRGAFLASTISGGFTGKVVDHESSAFETTLISVTSDGLSPVKIRFKTSDLRVPTEEEINKFEERIKRASEDARDKIRECDQGYFDSSNNKSELGC